MGEHQGDWDVYVGPLTYAYNSHVHRSTRTKPFEVVISRPPPELSFRRVDGDVPPSHSGNQRAEFFKTLDSTIQGLMGACIGRRLATSATSISA